MAKKVSNGLDLVGAELQNSRVHNLGAAPPSPGAGQFWYNSTDGYMYYRDAQAGANRQIMHYTQFLAIPLNQFAAPTAALNLNNQRITNLLDPTNAQDAATKAYVDAAIQGIKWKDAVRAGVLTNITLSGLQTADGVSLAAGDRVAVMGQTTGSQNGIYVVASGTWSRAADANSSAEIPGMAFFVSEGTANGNKLYVCTTDGPISLDSTALVFAQIGAGTSYTAGTGLTISGSTISVDTAVMVRKFVALIGNGTLTSITVTHNLGTPDVVVALRKVSNNEAWEADYVATTSNSITLTFTTAPTSNEYSVVIMG